MKIIPNAGYAVLQVIKEDFVSKAGIIIPDNDKTTSFFNRMKIIAMGKTSPEFQMKYSIGEVVIISAAGAQIAVPGLIKNKSGDWIDVCIVPQGQIIAKIEGDIAEDWEKEHQHSKPIIIPPLKVN